MPARRALTLFTLALALAAPAAAMAQSAGDEQYVDPLGGQTTQGSGGSSGSSQGSSGSTSQGSSPSTSQSSGSSSPAPATATPAPAPAAGGSSAAPTTLAHTGADLRLLAGLGLLLLAGGLALRRAAYGRR